MIEETLIQKQALACPACSAPLAADGTVVACPACGLRWPCPEGVALLGEAHDFPQDLPSEQLTEMVSLAESAGWQAALHDYMRPLDPQRYRHAVDEYRAQWRCLLPQHAGARVLDFRCGWGPITVSLAEDYGLVVAADTRAELARFTALRARTAGAGNVQAVSLDPRRRLPFPTGFFDGVVLQSALEWGDPEALLHEVARVLAPSGWVFVNVPNRLSAPRLLQSAQSALKRADTIGQPSTAVAVEPQLRSLTASLAALSRAGFSAGVAFAILPSEAEPFYVVPLGSRGALRFFLDNLFNDASLHQALAERRLLAPFKLARALWLGLRLLPVEPVLGHFMPGYGLLAQRR